MIVSIQSGAQKCRVYHVGSVTIKLAPVNVVVQTEGLETAYACLLLTYITPDLSAKLIACFGQPPSAH